MKILVSGDIEDVITCFSFRRKSNCRMFDGGGDVVFRTTPDRQGRKGSENLDFGQTSFMNAQ